MSSRERDQTAELVPLFAVAPKQSEKFPPPPSPDLGSGRRPTVTRTEFGWDCRYEGGSGAGGADLSGYAYHPDFAQPPQAGEHRAALPLTIGGIAAAVFLLLVLGLPGKIVSALQPSPAAATAAATPSALPTPTPTFTSLIAPPPVSISGGGTVFHFRGGFATESGITSTHCANARTSPQSCTWGFALSSTTPVYLHLQSQASLLVQLQVYDNAGHRLASKSDNSGSVTLTLPSPPANITVTVLMRSTKANSFDLAISEHPL